MKKTTIIRMAILLIAILSINHSVFTQGFKDLDEAPHDISYYRESRATPPIIKVIYGRPMKNGHDIFGDQIAYGKIWRTGANEATEVKFYQDIMFGNIKVQAGTYVLYTIPGEKKWEVILSSNLDVLGAFQYDSIFDVARITVSSSKAEELEAFSITFKEKKDRIQMVLGWDTTRVTIPIGVKIKDEYADNYKNNILPKF